MANAKKIRDGVFLINWINEQFEQASLIDVHCPDILGNSFPQCSLFSEIEDSTCSMYVNFLHIFEMLPITYMEFDRAKAMNIWASKDGVQRKMTLQDCDDDVIPSWTAEWTIPMTCPCNGLPKILKIEFEILIDLNPSYEYLVHQNRKRLEALKHMANLLQNLNPTDVTFKLQDKSVKSNSAVLAYSSPVLAAMFRDDFKEKHEMVIEVTDIKAGVFEQLVQYAYTKEANFNKVDVADLMVAADKYGVIALKEECEDHLIQNLKVENVDSFLVLAHLHSLPKLTVSSMEFIAKNPKPYISGENWTELMKSYPEIAIKVTRRLLDTV